MKEKMSGHSTKKTAGVWEQTTANEMLVTGAALGSFGAAATLLAGAVCPVCAIGTPLLLGGGIVKKLQEKKKRDAGKHASKIDTSPDSGASAHPES